MSTREKWSPDPKIISFIETSSQKDKTGRICVGRRILTWKQVVNEVRRGTSFGRLFYEGAVEFSDYLRLDKKKKRTK